MAAKEVALHARGSATWLVVCHSDAECHSATRGSVLANVRARFDELRCAPTQRDDSDDDDESLSATPVFGLLAGSSALVAAASLLGLLQIGHHPPPRHFLG
jgi:hypothetical protein